MSEKSKPSVRVVHQGRHGFMGRVDGVTFDDPGGPVAEVFARRADVRSRAERAIDRRTRDLYIPPAVRVEV